MKYLVSQYNQIVAGGYSVLWCKIMTLLSLVAAVPFVVILFFLQPFYLVRWKELRSSRIGHFAANTELYCCERDVGINVPKSAYVDIFYMEPEICNQYLADMWRRELFIVPDMVSFIFVAATRIINNLKYIIPALQNHFVGDNKNEDRDVLDLLNEIPPHLSLTTEEKKRGEKWLSVNNIPNDAKIVLLIVRDNAYLGSEYPSGEWGYHDYRDCEINNFVLAAKELANRGYYVVRMGKVVNKPIVSDNPLIIDYATNGMRNDFIDIYLSYICSFVVTTSTGIDAVADVCFRKKSVTVNYAPIINVISYFKDSLFIPKHYVRQLNKDNLKLSEILMDDIGLCFETQCYMNKNIELIENTPEEIHDIVIEMVERIEGVWKTEVDDEFLQNKFWDIFPVNATNMKNKPIHGNIRSRVGANFLRENHEWAE